MQRIPLAERMRPLSINDVIGQKHLLDDGKILRQIIDNKEPVSLILWGPSGCGKTTLARIIASEANAEFIEISAVTSGKKDITTIIEHARQNWNLKLRTIIFVDEIHRFNKAQQDAFLPHIESGLITLIGATTENPSFEIINPLLSRSRVLNLQPLKTSEIALILKNAIKLDKKTKLINSEAIDFIAELSEGDARIALGNLDLVLSLSQNSKITVETVKSAIQKQLPRYDKKGEMHFNVISAFIKSMRASNVDATLYYLAKMIDAGEDPKFIARRMVIFASEDIGLAGNGALGLALNAFMAVERIGMPESTIILGHVATALARSEKSRQTTDAIGRAMEITKKYPSAMVPLHLTNTSNKFTDSLDFNDKQQQRFLPKELEFEKIF